MPSDLGLHIGAGESGAGESAWVQDIVRSGAGERNRTLMSSLEGRGCREPAVRRNVVPGLWIECSWCDEGAEPPAPWRMLEVAKHPSPPGNREAPMETAYDSRQVVGMDLHQWDGPQANSTHTPRLPFPPAASCGGQTGRPKDACCAATRPGSARSLTRRPARHGHGSYREQERPVPHAQHPARTRKPPIDTAPLLQGWVTVNRRRWPSLRAHGGHGGVPQLGEW